LEKLSMKKSLIALAALAVVTAASAQSTVVLSGSVSMGLQQTGTSVAAQTTQVAGVDGVSSNSFNFTATEDLGGGMTATAVINNRLSALNADLGTGDLFVNLSGGFGQVRAGRYTWSSNSGYNAFASRTVTGLGGAGQALGSNNTLQYTTPGFNGLTATLAYQANQFATGTAGTGVKVNYAAGPMALQIATSTAPQGGITGVEAKVDSIGATYDLGVAKIFFHYYDQSAGETIANSTSGAYTTGNTTALIDDTGTSLSIAVPMGAATLKAGIIDRAPGAGTLPAALLDRTSIGVDYALSKRTMLIAEFATDKHPTTGATKRTNYFIGASHSF
jgi:predicted porin